MSVSTRQKIGASLIGISIAAFMIGLMVGSHSREVGGGSSGGVVWFIGGIGMSFNWRYAIPIILCGAVGVFCLAWPSRKPTKLPG